MALEGTIKVQQAQRKSQWIQRSQLKMQVSYFKKKAKNSLSTLHQKLNTQVMILTTLLTFKGKRGMRISFWMPMMI
jgi:hypothetical protein